MALKSAYVPHPEIENDLIRIGGDEHRHLVVARAEPNETVEVFDGNGTVWTAVIVQAGRSETCARVTSVRRVDRERHELILGQALIRAAAFELALEKAVEIGVTRIVPFVAARSNVSAGRRPERWMRIIVEAAKQSKRYYLPELNQPVGFEQILQIDAPSKIMFAERGGGPLKPALTRSPVLYLTGPEGGWTDAEIEAARQNRFILVNLGTGILKAETAAIVGGALIRYELERLQNG